MKRTISVEYMLRELRELAAVLPQVGPARAKIEALIETLLAHEREAFCPRRFVRPEK